MGELLPKLDIYVIYGSPRDFPGEFVARRSRIGAGRIEPDPEIFARATTLEALRERLPRGLYRLNRHQNDDPTIVECWL